MMTLQLQAVPQSPAVTLVVDELHVRLEVAGRVVVDGFWPDVQDSTDLRRLAEENGTIRTIVDILDRPYRNVCD